MFQPPRPPTVFLLSQGDEVITGQTVDTNAATLSEWLTELGFLVTRRVTVGDVMEDIVAAIAEGLNSADVLICTGGLGPTALGYTLAPGEQGLGGLDPRRPADAGLYPGDLEPGDAAVGGDRGA